MININDIKKTYIEYIEQNVSLTEEWGREATIQETLGGNILDEEAQKLYEIIKENTHVKDALQIGTYIGYSGVFIANPLQERKGTLTTIDPNHPHRNINKPQDVAKDVYKKLGLNNVKFIEGYSNQQNSIYDQTIRFVKLENRKEHILDNLIKENKKFDFIFIDGNHNPEIVTQDFSKSVQLLNPKGIIIMHDVRGTERVRNVVLKIQEKYFEFNYEETQTSAGLGIFKLKE